MPAKTTHFSVSRPSPTESIALTYRPPPPDTAVRRNRDVPLDAATQYFTLHLYSTNQARPTDRKSRDQVRAPRPAPMPGSLRGAIPEAEEQEEEEDDDDHPWGNWGSGRRGMAQEDTSMKKIKNVQGVDGSWTITDCDADTKGAK